MDSRRLELFYNTPVQTSVQVHMNKHAHTHLTFMNIYKLIEQENPPVGGFSLLKFSIGKV